MSDGKMVKFRGAMGGYSKKDVNRYIEQISLDFARREEELKGDIESEKRKVSEAKSRIDELTHMLDELACEAYSSENAASLAEIFCQLSAFDYAHFKAPPKSFSSL